MLKEAILAGLVSAPESRTLEKKKSCPNGGELRKSLVALANSTHDDEYSVLLLGVTDDGKPVGLTGLDSMQKTVLQVATQECHPPIPIEIQAFRFGEHDLLAVIVRDTFEKPYFTGRSYVRVGSVSQEASKKAFEDLIAQRHDKVRRLLREKDRVISLNFLEGERVSSLSMVTGGTYTPPPNRREYVLTDCDAWIVKFKEKEGSGRFAYPVEDVKIEWDSGRDRLQLGVPGRRPKQGVLA